MKLKIKTRCKIYKNTISHLTPIYMKVFRKTFLKSLRDSFFVVGDRSFQSAKTLLKDLRSPQLVTDFVVRMISLERVL